MMNIVFGLIRCLLALQFGYAGIEKLFLPFDRKTFLTHYPGELPFSRFYLLLQDTGYLHFVGFFQLLCALLLLFPRTWLLGSIMLVPMLLCLLATHVFISGNMANLAYDIVLLLFNTILILTRFNSLKRTFLQT